MRRFKWYLVGALVSALLASLSFIATPFFLGLAIDAMALDMKQVVYYLGMSFVLYAFYAVFSVVTQVASQKAGLLYTEDVRSRLIDRLESVSLAYLDTTSHGYLLSVFTNDSQLFQDGLVQVITQGFQGLFTVVIAAIFMLTIDGTLTLVVFLSIPIMMLSSYYVNKYSSLRFKERQNLNALLNDHITQYIENDELIMTNAYEDILFDRFESTHDALNDVGEKAQFLGALVNPTTRLVNNISYMFIGLLGSFVVIDKGISIGVLTSFISYSVMFSKPLNEFSSVFSDVSLGMVAYSRIQDLLQIPLQKDVAQHELMKGDTITMKDVYFSYNDSIPAIEGLNLEIKPLSKVAIVGPTGSGKSTLINLLLRYYDVNRGVFELDGVDVETISRSSVRHVMGVVMQEPWLFKGSVMDNLVYGHPGVDRQRMIEMCHQVGCYDFIMSLDNGFESMIGDITLSQGQKQMITIVRALLSHAPILLLDEATSNIDLVSEAIIQKTLTEVMKTHTSFFVAHRLQTIKNSDLILVMKEGRLIETGTHQSLMELNGFYRELVSSQD